MGAYTRQLGSTGATVTALGYGAMELRGKPRSPELSDAEAGRLLGAVLDAGITLVDTSPDYGASEALIGRHIGHRRSEYFLASKCGCPLDLPADALPPYPHDYRRERIVADVEQSLRRLGTDHLDLLQVHMTPSRHQLEQDGTVETLMELRDAGKTRFIGMSGTIPHLADHLDMGVFEAFQIPYSALQRDHETLMAQATAGGAGVIVRGGVARGTLTGGERRPIGIDKDEARRRWQDAHLDDLAAQMGSTAFMLRFALSNPDVHSVIVGTASVEHLRANVLAAEEGPLPAEIYAEATRRLDAVASPPR